MSTPNVDPMVTLDVWAKEQYGEAAPTVGTLRRWCRELKIHPAPQKHGRSYFLRRSARYVGDFNDRGFLEAIRGTTQTQHS